MSDSPSKSSIRNALQNWVTITLLLAALAGLVTAATLAPALTHTTTVPDAASSEEEPSGLLSVIFDLLPQFGQESVDQVVNGDVQTDPDSSTLDPGGSIAFDDAQSGDSPTDLDQSTETHFTAETPTPVYWRTSAYSEYTGSGWTQPSNLNPATDTRSSTSTGQETVEQIITLNQSTTRLPSAWKPHSISIDGVSVEAKENGELRTSEPVEAGTTYTVTSTTTPPSSDSLNNTGTNYPPEVTDRYTDVPDSTPSQVESFTDTVTASSETPYESTIAIETWLEENNEFAPNASHASGEDMVEQFLFEMNEGSQEYYATSMVVMLRTQGIPARYTVGYSPGVETNSTNTYDIKGFNSHAWVEVYFPDEGWVKFDPTPEVDRQEEEQRIADSQPSASAPGSPDPPYNIELDSERIPGTTVTATITKDSTPVEGVVVEFNGEAIGETDANGSTTGTVPYTETLNVSVRNPDVTSHNEKLPAGGVPAGDSNRFYSVSEHSNDDVTDTDTNSTSRTYAVSSNITFDFSPQPTTGSTTELTATISSEAIPDATVFVDDVAVGETDSNGQYTISVPDSTTSSITVTVQRDEITTTETIPLAPIEVDVTAPLLVGFPGQTGVVHVSAGDTAIENAVITHDDERIGTTDANGELSITYPWSWESTLTATGYGQTSTQTVYPGLHAFGVVVLGLTIFGGVGYYARRRGVTLHTVIEFLQLTGKLVRDTVVTALVAFTDHLGDLGVYLHKLFQNFYTAIIEGLQNAHTKLTQLTIPAIQTRLRAWIRQQWQSLHAWIHARVPHYTQSQNTPTAHTDPSQSHITDSQQSIRDAWKEIADRSGSRRWNTKTPRELAHNAQKNGVPSEPIVTLTHIFRDIEYSDTDPTPEDVEAATIAADNLTEDKSNGDN